MKNNIISIIISKRGGKGIISFSDVKYTLQSPATVSVSIHNGEQMVKLLTCYEHKEAGVYDIYWDGTDEYNVSQQEGNYTAKVVIHNITSTWRGAHIGNTATANSGDTIPHNNTPVCDIAIAGTKAALAAQYSERNPSIWCFNTNAINSKQNILAPGYSNALTTNVTTDGTYFYYAGYDAYSFGHNSGYKFRSFIYAYKCSDLSPLLFSSGQDYTLDQLGETFRVAGFLETNSAPSAIANTGGNVTSYTGGTIAPITAIAVSGNYLFICRATYTNGIYVSGAIYVIDKTTGASVATITNFNKPTNIACDNAGHIWIAHDTNVVSRYNINSDISGGVLNLTTGVINIVTGANGVTTPGCIRCTNDGTKVGILDLATNQLKLYNNADGSYIRTIGRGGNYVTDAKVYDDKFSFSPFITGFNVGVDNGVPYADPYTGNVAGGAGFNFDPADDSIWIANIGNNRNNHFNITGDFIESIMMQGTLYSVRTDLTNPTRIFGNFIEFNVPDLTATISGTSGWSMVYNWAEQINNTIYNEFEAFKSVHTYTVAGRSKVFGFLRRNDGGSKFELVELVYSSNATLRFTGIFKNYCIITKNGDLVLQDEDQTYNPVVARYQFLGSFDSNGNPLWSSSPEILANLNSLLNSSGNSEDKTLAASSLYNLQCQQYTNDKLVLWVSGTKNLDQTNYNGRHFAIFNRGTGTIVNRFQISTFSTYLGYYPNANYFDIGNTVNQDAGGPINVIDDEFIINSYHGEFWKAFAGGGQANRYNIYHISGLPILQFGTDRLEANNSGNGVNYPGMAGNALSPIFFKIAGQPNKIFGLHGGESDFSAIHLWEIDGLDTLSIQVIPFTLSIPNQLLPPSRGINMLSGLTFGQPVPQNSNGWLTDTEVANTTDTQFETIAGFMNPNIYTPDIKIEYKDKYNVNGIKKVVKDFRDGSVIGNWKVKGQYSRYNSFPSFANGYSNQAHIEILDAASKVICRYGMVYNGYGTVLFNDVFLSNASMGNPAGSGLTDIEIERVGNTLTARFNNIYYNSTTNVFETGADKSTPKYLRLIFFSGGGDPSYGKVLVVSDFWFTTT